MRVGIVGGGISGLAVCHALARRGIAATVFEASDMVGGAIRTHVDGDEVIELGAQRTRLVGSVRRLVDELALDSQLLKAPPGAQRFVWAEGRLHPFPTSDRATRTTSLLPPRTRQRLLQDPLEGAVLNDESVAEYITRTCGRAAYHRLFGPVVSAMYGSDPNQMDASLIMKEQGLSRALAGMLRANNTATDTAADDFARDGAGEASNEGAAFTFRAGLGVLPNALAARYESRVYLQRPVESVRRSEHGHTQSGWEVVWGGPDPGSQEVDRLVLTVPGPEAGRLLAPHAPETAAGLSRLTYNRVVVVPVRVPGSPQGFGMQVSLGSSLRIRGVTWNDYLFGRNGICTVYLGGGLDPQVAEWQDDRIAEVVKTDYEAIHGDVPEVLQVARPALPAWDRSWRDLRFDPPRNLWLCGSYAARLGIATRIEHAERVAAEVAERGP